MAHWHGSGVLSLIMQQIGKYRLERELGGAANSRVFLAIHATSHRKVALKLLPETQRFSVEEREQERKAFLRTARVAGQLQHANIVAVLDSGAQGGTAFMAMEYFESTSLEKMLRDQSPMEPATALGILKQVAAALDYSHRSGLVHRDIKPGKVLCNRQGEAKVTGFGLARSLTGRDSRVGALPPAPHYLAPEQLQGDTTAFSDQYSLATVAFRMLAGKRPFEGGNVIQLMQKIAFDEPPSMSDLNPRVRPRVSAVVAKALAKKESARYPSCGDFANALEAAIGEKPLEPDAGKMAIWAALARYFGR
jgi:serine/threonine protein kinase